MTSRRVITAETLPSEALRDLFGGALRYEVWWRFALYDIKQRFRRSVIGPLWITVSVAILIAALGLVFSTLAQMELEKMLLYIATGVIFWSLLSTCINEGAPLFISIGTQIRSLPIELSMHLYRMIARNIIVFLFNMVIYFVILTIFPPPPSLDYLLFVPGFILFMLNVAWTSFALAILSARYRDVPQIAANLMQILFILTPVFWSPDALPARPAFITWNPAYHLLEVVREPLIGGAPSALSWIVAFCAAVLGCGVTTLLYQRAFPRIAYWV